MRISPPSLLMRCRSSRLSFPDGVGFSDFFFSQNVALGMSESNHAPARKVGGMRVPGPNPNRPHAEDDEATPQAHVTQALDSPGGHALAKTDHPTSDMKEKQKHDHKDRHDPQHPKHDKAYNNKPDVKSHHMIQQPGGGQRGM